DARGGLARVEAIGAHVALANDTLARVILRRVVGACQGAVLTAETLIVEVADDPRDRVLLVSIDRAGAQARRVEAVVARRGDVLEDRQPPIAAHEQAHVAPALLVIQAVQRMTGRHARLAARTSIEVYLERELLARPRRPGRHQRAIEAALEGS